MLDGANPRWAALNTCATSAMIVVCAQVFGYFLTMTGATQSLVDWVDALAIHKGQVLTVVDDS